MASGNGFTPTEKRLLEVLSDGEPHSNRELRKLFNDDMACENNLNQYISTIRKKLDGSGTTIALRYIKGLTHYQHVRHLHSPYDGRT